MIEIFFGILFGSAVGSALGCAAMRYCEGKSWAWGRSRCDGCKIELPAKQLIPVVSFCLQKGKSTCCGLALSPMYLIVELTGAVLGGYIGWLIAGDASIWALTRIGLIFIFVLFTITMDGRYLLVSIPLCVGFSAIMLLLPYEYGTVLNRLIMAGGICLFFGVQYLYTKGKGIGTGDFFLGISLGTALGFPLGLFALLFGYLFGAGHAVILLLKKKAHRKTQLPLGLYLMIGMVVAMIFAPQLLEWVGISLS